MDKNFIQAENEKDHMMEMEGGGFRGSRLS